MNREDYMAAERELQKEAADAKKKMMQKMVVCFVIAALVIMFLACID